MKVCVIHGSKHGNGLKCAEYMQMLSEEYAHHAEVFHVKKTDPKTMPVFDMYVIVSPTYIGRTPHRIKKFLKKLDPNVKNVSYVIIMTGGEEKITGIEAIRKIVEKRHWNLIAAPIKVRVESKNGPLEENYRLKLEAFAKQLF